MSSIANAAAAPASGQQYFQAAQKTDTAKAAPAVAPQTKTAVTSTSSSAPVESAVTRNSDGTYGPKHTLRSPALQGKTAQVADEVTSVNIKA